MFRINKGANPAILLRFSDRMQRQRRLAAADERDGQRERDVGRGQEGWEEGGVDRHRGRKTWPQTEGQGEENLQELPKRGVYIDGTRTDTRL